MLIPNTIFTGNSGQYQIGKVLGSGRTSTVFEAHPLHDATLKLVIKVMRADTGPTTTNLDAFRTEVEVLNDWLALAKNQMELLTLFQPPTRVAQAYQKPYPVPTPYMIESRTAGATPYYIIMERATGKTIAQMLREERKPLDEAFGVQPAYAFSQLLTVLHTRLERSFTDMKLENLWWHESGRLMVTDWNVVSQRGRVEAARDLQNWGQMLFLIFTGVPIEEYLQGGGLAAETLGEIGGPAWQALSSGLKGVLTRLFAPQPADRYGSMQALTQDFESLYQAWCADNTKTLQVAILQRLHSDPKVAGWMLAIADKRHLDLPDRATIDDDLADITQQSRPAELQGLFTHLWGRNWREARKVLGIYSATVNTPFAHLSEMRWQKLIALGEARHLPEEKPLYEMVVDKVSQGELSQLMRYLDERLKWEGQSPKDFRLLQWDERYAANLKEANKVTVTAANRSIALDAAKESWNRIRARDTHYADLLEQVLPFPTAEYERLERDPAVVEVKKPQILRGYLKNIKTFSMYEAPQFMWKIQDSQELDHLKQYSIEFPYSPELRQAFVTVAVTQLRQGAGWKPVKYFLDLVSPSPVAWEHEWLVLFLSHIEAAHLQLKNPWKATEWELWDLLWMDWQKAATLEMEGVTGSFQEWLRPTMADLARAAVVRWRGILTKPEPLADPTTPEAWTFQIFPQYLELVRDQDQPTKADAMKFFDEINKSVDYYRHKWKKPLEELVAKLAERLSQPQNTIADLRSLLAIYDELAGLVAQHQLYDKDDEPSKIRLKEVVPSEIRLVVEHHLAARQAVRARTEHAEQIIKQIDGIALQMNGMAEPTPPGTPDSPLAQLHEADKAWFGLGLLGAEKINDMNERFRDAGKTYINNHLREAALIGGRKEAKPTHGIGMITTPRQAAESLGTLMGEIVQSPLPCYSKQEQLTFRAVIDERVRVYHTLAQSDQWLDSAESKLEPLLKPKQTVGIAAKQEGKPDLQTLHYIEMALNEAEARLNKVTPPSETVGDQREWWRTAFGTRHNDYQTLYQALHTIRTQQVEEARRLIVRESVQRGESLQTVPRLKGEESKSLTPQDLWQVIGQWGTTHLRAEVGERLKDVTPPPKDEWIDLTKNEGAIITMSVPIVLIVTGLDHAKWHQDIFALTRTINQHFLPIYGHYVTDGFYTWGKIGMHRTSLQTVYKGSLPSASGGGISIPGFSGRKNPIEIIIAILDVP
jgi:hypothetical protein